MRMEESRERLELYRMFAGLLFKLPDADFVKMVKSLEVPAGGSDASDMLAAYALEAQGKSDEALLSELRVDRTRLLNGAVKEGGRPPYESAYLGSDPFVLLQRLNELYRESGYGFAKSRSEQSDHIAKEVGFMQMLCEREVDAVAAGDEALFEQLREQQRSFFSSHLGRWAHRFACETGEVAKTGFYRAVAMMLADHVAAEAELLGAELAL